MSQFSTQTGMQTPGQLDVFFTRSMARSVAAVGSTAGLEPLEWRARSRRWCSMQRCGNRAKVRAHRARLAGSTGTADAGV